MKIKQHVRTSINSALSDLTRPRLPHIPMGDITAVLAHHNLSFEDCILCGREGRSTHELECDGSPVENAMLVLNWLKGDHDGSYEVIAYVS